MNKQELFNTVQLNCHISDANFAGNYTMCVYLLKMREFYRWEQALPFSGTLSKDDIGQWLIDREDLWNNVEEQDYAKVNILGTDFDPFDSNGINHVLSTEKLVYSGGLGVKNKPHFFVADLETKDQIDDYSIYISGKEYARDLTSPPAMSHEKNIFIRRESFRRMIWERTDEWRWNKPANAMARAIACYDFDNHLESSLDQMTDKELNAAVLHEIGEIQAGQHLSGWHEMMSDISFTKAEIMARAVRDHFADTLHTLPTLIENHEEASIHFYFANLTNMRKHTFPSLIKAYNDWCETKNLGPISSLIELGHQHWKELAQEMLALHQCDAENCSAKIEALVDTKHL